MIVSEGRRRAIVALWESSSGSFAHRSSVALPDQDVDEFTNSLRKNAFSSALSWVEEDGGSKVIGSNGNRVVRIFLGIFTWDGIDSHRVLERNSPAFQSDEHAFRGHCGIFLWAEGSTSYEDKYLSFVLQFCMLGIFRWKSCTIFVNIGTGLFPLMWPCYQKVVGRLEYASRYLNCK